MTKKKCKKCGVPLEGLLGKIASFLGIKPSNKDPEICNKCDKQDEKKEEIKSEFHEEEFANEEVGEEEKRPAKDESYNEDDDIE